MKLIFLKEYFLKEYFLEIYLFFLNYINGYFTIIIFNIYMGT